MFMMSNITDITINLDEYLRNEHCSINYLYWFRYFFLAPSTLHQMEQYARSKTTPD